MKSTTNSTETQSKSPYTYKLLKEITQICLARLHELKPNPEGDNELYLDMKTRTLSYIDDRHDNVHMEHEIIQMWVTQSLNRHGRVFLYICPDNAEISLAHPKPDELQSALDVSYPWELNNAPSQTIFYIAKD